MLVDAVARMSAPPPVWMSARACSRTSSGRRSLEAGMENVVSFPGWVETQGPGSPAPPSRPAPARRVFLPDGGAGDGAWGPGRRHRCRRLPGDARRRPRLIVPAEYPEALAAALDGVLAGGLRPDTSAARTWARRFEIDRWPAVYEQGYAELRVAPAPALASVSGDPGVGDEADLHAWQILAPLLAQTRTCRGRRARCGRPQWSRSATRSSTALAAGSSNVARARAPWSSPVFCASAARAHWSPLEHDVIGRRWSRQLRRESLGEVARIRYAPLAVPALVRPARPPTACPTRSTCSSSTDRRPSTPATAPAGGRRFPGSGIDWSRHRVILDDIDRDGEREVLALWEEWTDWRFTLDVATGVATR